MQATFGAPEGSASREGLESSVRGGSYEADFYKRVAAQGPDTGGRNYEQQSNARPPPGTTAWGGVSYEPQRSPRVNYEPQSNAHPPAGAAAWGGVSYEPQRSPRVNYEPQSSPRVNYEPQRSPRGEMYGDPRGMPMQWGHPGMGHNQMGAYIGNPQFGGKGQHQYSY